MPFTLIMRRKVFARVQVMCDEYEDKFHEPVATASVVNVLLAEALRYRGLIPEDFIHQEYGCADPIGQGFTPNARKDKTPLEALQEKSELAKWETRFSGVLEQWPDHPDPEWRRAWIAKAELWKDKVPNAKLVLALANGEALNEHPDVS